jgi:hypothetical protein
VNIASEYDLRSLQHEQRMLDLYRRQSPSDGGLLQPLANACWRAASFDWRLHSDPDSTRHLWLEAAHALAEGFERKRAGFGRTHEDLFLALHLSIASRARDLLGSLVHMVPTATDGARSRRRARSQLLLLEAYRGIARSIVERKREHARHAQGLLEEARAEADYDWWKEQFPSAGEVAWKIEEYEAIRGLLSVIARFVGQQSEAWEKDDRTDADFDLSLCVEFGSLMDQALLRLDQFIELEINHRPKLNVWLPGVALAILASSAGLSLEWLEIRQEDSQKGYARLPLALVQPQV